MAIFKFKHFDIEQDGCAQKIGTDTMVLGAFVEHDFPENILDIGTGNGALALMAAQKFSTANIEGVEIQSKCALTANYNFKNSVYSSRLKVVNMDFNRYSTNSKKFELIISNPPYFRNDFGAPESSRLISRHQSKLKLESLIEIASKLLTNEGAIWLIVPNINSDEVINLALKANLKLIRKIRVFGKPYSHKRDILTFRKTAKKEELVVEDFTIRTLQGDYTDEYKSKTFEFHHSLL